MKMVPSDPWRACSPTGMHGQNVASENGVTLALNSPLPVLADLGSKRRCVSANPLPVEARFSMRPFTLQRRKLTFRPVPAAKSMFLAYIFKTIQETLLRPVRHHAPAPFGLLFASRDHSPHDTRCQIRLPDSPSVFELPLPPGTSRSLRFVAPNPTPTEEACLCRLPDLPSLPVPRKF
jgi:hypothetical protein